MAVYQRFDPDLWRTVFNFECMCTLTTTDTGNLVMTGFFTTEGDYIGVYYQSEDVNTHDYYKYTTNYDYTDVTFSFVPEYTGKVAHFNDRTLKTAMNVIAKDGTEYIVTLGFYGQKNDGSDSFLFDGEIELSNPWIDVGSETVEWTKEETVQNEDGSTSTVTRSGTGEIGTDYDMDYVDGVFFTKEGGIPYNADVDITYTYNTHEKYTLNFNNLYEGTHPDLQTMIDPTTISKMTFSIIPDYYVEGSRILTGRTDDFTITLSGIEVGNGELNTKPEPMPRTVYRPAEGFDDEYDKNPKRLMEQMNILGYEKLINLYIGASHFHYKVGQEGEESTGYNVQTIDTTKGINEPFRVWLQSFLKHMKLNNFDDIIISVSMEHLQMPDEWKQLMYDGQPGATGWQPSTNFYDPNNEAVQTYIRKISKEILDIVQNEGMQVTLQLGEPWYWWQEFQPGNVNQPFEGQPPCFYSPDTLNRYESETGEQLPVYEESKTMATEENKEVWKKLKHYLGDYSEFMKSIANEYDNSRYTVLFFPPSVLDKERVPVMMQEVNTPFHVWNDNQLDFIQIEDYDWVTSENDQHVNVYPYAWLELGYPFIKQHYFAGFVLKPENADKEWPLIEKAAAGAVGRQFKETFIWAGTQIRRDSWTPRQNYYSSDCEAWMQVNLHQYGE
ncbi:non-contractile tail sheath protein [Salimicrobium salexigens]|uniref:Uncharacterized protein n=1 Tax=Salimicrobium salexigens TaxID=908941 RepID=A0ABY1KY50_9BACI|nr:hypothetical protein [Salimicrobium salexigens]SIS89255.1 hypothetical protein SAMN05421758_108133 [Salimicrobium salexigens]